jgi:hypothetical protein
LDTSGDLCGCVEGIVPVNHADERLAGSAAFIPSYVVAAFVDYIERGLLEKIMPPELFQMTVTAKATGSVGGIGSEHGTNNYEEAYEAAVTKLRGKYSDQEVEAIMQTIQEERDQVLEILNSEGGDVQDIMQRVRAKTVAIREMVLQKYREEKELEKNDHDGKALPQQ